MTFLFSFCRPPEMASKNIRISFYLTYHIYNLGQNIRNAPILVYMTAQYWL